jgi:antitoxin component YwqK of YwqJK toxin-antitoxin module
MQPVYESSIPETAEERITRVYPDGAKQQAEYWLAGERVGMRTFFETGELEMDAGLRQDHYHGICYRWDVPGELLSATPYHEGLEHGTAYQWASDGSLLGSYTIEYGTGIDLWWCELLDSTVGLSEVRYFQGGKRHGFEWWIRSDQHSVYEESHYTEGQPHGILRQWSWRGKLRRGYPQYYIRGERVTKARYTRACQHDPTLPSFRPEDNLPARTFPAEITAHLSPAPGKPD